MTANTPDLATLFDRHEKAVLSLVELRRLYDAAPQQAEGGQERVVRR